ncbi:hypothetical protein BJX62DRAFT_221376 [Aspergillus germanicus]
MKFPRSALRLASCHPAFCPQTYHARLRPVVQRFQSSTPPEQTPWNLESPAPKPSDAAVGVLSELLASQDPLDISETADVSLDTPPVDPALTVEVHDFDDEYSESSVDIPGLEEDEAEMHEVSEGTPDAPSKPAALNGRVIQFMKRFHLELENPELIARALRCTDLKPSDDVRSFSLVGGSVFRLYAAAVGQENGYPVSKVVAILRMMYSHKALARQAWNLRLDEATDLRHIMAAASDFNKQTLDYLLAISLEAVVGAVFIDKKRSLPDIIPFLEALGLAISEKNMPKLYGLL